MNRKPDCPPACLSRLVPQFSGSRPTAAEQIPRILFVSWKKRSLTTDSRDDRIGWRILRCYKSIHETARQQTITRSVIPAFHVRYLHSAFISQLLSYDFSLRRPDTWRRDRAAGLSAQFQTADANLSCAATP